MRKITQFNDTASMTQIDAYEIAIQVGDDRWKKALENIDELAARAIDAAYKQIDVSPFTELSLAFLSDTEVQSLNKNYRNQDKPTNVLSFLSLDASGVDNLNIGTDEVPLLLGDIVLAFETVSAEAEKQNITLGDHVSHLLIHGFYHLQGYDHETEQEAGVMEALEIKALAALGIANPYDKENIL